ncbi:hypothetical protein DdX_17560 [Ditylenchus destructor]|uniref:F-box domain-containing protein n=1 Tax=Ditylenchus destructor TaxID=166010 RepID=A0AAD4MM65_9BILA|nr:hypothetical protein DdX_17560 [Ditylenchus destructor]
MSCSKPLPPFTFDLLYFLDRNQLERFSIVCRPLKNFIDRYFRSKPYRVFRQLCIRGGSYALVHNSHVQWHPNREDYSAQQFLAGQTWKFDDARDYTYYSFAEMRPYLGLTVRIKKLTLMVVGDSTYSPEHIAEMEAIAFLWRDGDIKIRNAKEHGAPIVAEDFLPILNSATILQCRELKMYKAHFSFKDYKILYTVQVIRLIYERIYYERIDPTHIAQFLEHPGVKPVVCVVHNQRASIANVLDHLCKVFSSGVVSNPYKVVFSLYQDDLIKFRETNKTSGEKLELKKRIPIAYERIDLNYNDYTLERSSI